MQTNKTYVLSPYVLALRDKPHLFAKKHKATNHAQAIVLEQNLNDLYHHFLYSLTKEMQQDRLQNEAKLTKLFNDMLEIKKKLQEM